MSFNFQGILTSQLHTQTKETQFFELWVLFVLITDRFIPLKEIFFIVMMPWMLILLRSNLILLSWNSPVDLDSSHAFPTGSPPVITFFFSLFICSCYLQIPSFALILLLLLKISFLCYHHNELLWSPPKCRRTYGLAQFLRSVGSVFGHSVLGMCVCICVCVCVCVCAHVLVFIHLQVGFSGPLGKLEGI